MENLDRSDGSGDGLARATRDELYAMARDREIAGRSTMSKDELFDALAESDAARGDEVASRVEAFAQLARAAASGDFVMLPRMLRGHDRRVHVRQTLREDHQTRIAQKSEDAAAKFDELADSLFSFFRGTALLFYRDMAGEDAWMPTVLALGDVHPENFGVMPNANGVPIFGVNDFDESYYAPFTWDLERGAVGFAIAAGEEGGYGEKKRQKIVRRFVRGYVEGIRRFAKEGTERDHELRIDNGPKLVKELIEDAKESRAEWLAEDYLDEQRRGFRADEDLVPLTTRRDEFQAILERLVRENDIDVPARAGSLRLKDVAERHNQGTASLGLARYYLLVEGPNADGTDDLIIELKRARRSALAGLVPASDHAVGRAGKRIAHAQMVQLVRGDVFYGSTDVDGTSFMSRERAPFRDDIDLGSLSKKEWKRYAKICGRALAHAHALSDEHGDIEHDIEPKIVAAMANPVLFEEDIVQWASEAAARVRRDHEMFCEDHALDAFRTVDRVFE